MAGLEALPAEIILQIHLISTSSTLPSVSRYIQSCISDNATPLYRSRWLTLKLASEGIRPCPPSVSISSSSSSSSSLSICGNSARKGKRRRQHFANESENSNSNESYDPDAIFLSRALRYGACDIDTLYLLERKCRDNLYKRLMARYKEQLEAHVKREIKRSKSHIQVNTSGTKEQGSLKAPQEPPYPAFLPLPPRAVDIPKRLFRNLQASSPPPPSTTNAVNSTQATPSASLLTDSLSLFESRDYPFLLHIMNKLQANPNSSRGYPLAKAVLARHVPLIQLLLEQGADPSTKDYMAVMLAIGRNDIEIVKLLVERGSSSSSSSHGSSGSSGPIGTRPSAALMYTDGVAPSKKRKRMDGTALPAIATSISTSSPKKRKLEDRFSITSEMLELAVKQQCEPLIHYFMAKGAIPNLKTLQMLQA